MHYALSAIVYHAPWLHAELAGPICDWLEAHGAANDDCLRYGRTIMSSRSEEHTSELQSLMRISYAVFCLKKKNKRNKAKSTHLNVDSQHKQHTEHIHPRRHNVN